MPIGRFEGIDSSPIVQAIAQAEAGTTGEIRVHLSKRPIERNAFGRALRLFSRYGMEQTSQHNAVLLYVNLRRRKLAIIGDAGISKAVGTQYWENLARELRENLLSTHPERAIAIAVIEVGKVLQKHFPNSNEIRTRGKPKP